MCRSLPSSYNPITIYTLYEITDQIKKILNTYSEDVTQIKLYGEYIYLNSASLLDTCLK